MSKKFISTNVVKAIAIVCVIFLHSLQYNPNVTMSDIAQKLGFNFWVYQAVSAFLIILGFHYAISYKKGKGIWNWFSRDNFYRKLLRILIPYSLFFVVQMAYYCICKGWSLELKTIFFYLQGGIGPGGYYTVIIFQILILFPVLFMLIEKSPLFGTILIVGVNVVYEIAVKYGIFRDSFNRLCCIRVLTGIVFGILLFYYFDQLRNSVIPQILFVVGTIFMGWYSFGEYKTQIITKWVTTSFMSMVYVAGILYFCILHEEKWVKLKENIICKYLFGVFEFLGRASFHIFLMQQLWFCIDCSYRSVLRIRYACVIDILICLVLGSIFFILQDYLLKKINLLKGKFQ